MSRVLSSRILSPRWLFLALFAGALTLPFLMPVHAMPLPSFYNELTGGALWVALLLCGVLLPQLAPPSAFPRIAVVPVGLLLVLCLQAATLTIVNPTSLRIGIAYLGMAALLTYLGYRLRGLAGLTGVAAGAAIVGGLLSVVVEIVQACHPSGAHGGTIMFGGLIDARATGRLIANVAQPNHLASYLSWGLAGVLYLHDSARLKWRSAGVLIFLLLAGIAATGSRTAIGHVLLIGVVFGGLHYGASSASGLRPAARRWRAAALPLGLLLAYFAAYKLLGWIDQVCHLGLGADTLAQMTDGTSMLSRLQLWHYGWQMFLQTPWLGGGWGGFPNWEYQHLEQFGHVDAAISAHNIVLDLLAQTGVLGAGVFVLGLAAWAWRVLRHGLTRQRAFWFCLLGVVLVHALVEFPLDYCYFLFPCAFALGLLDTAPARWSGLRLPSLLSAALLPVMLAGLLILTNDMIKVQRFFYAPDLQAGMREYWDHQAVLLSRYGSYAVATGISVNGAHPEARLQMQRDALAVMPMPGVITNYIVALALLGQDDAALDQVRRLRLYALESAYSRNFILLLLRCNEQGHQLAGFTAKLMSLRPSGMPASFTHLKVLPAGAARVRMPLAGMAMAPAAGAMGGDLLGATGLNLEGADPADQINHQEQDVVLDHAEVAAPGSGASAAAADAAPAERIATPPH